MTHEPESDRKGTVFSASFLRHVADVAASIDPEQATQLADLIADVRRSHGRLFILGLGGSAANASHAAGDLRLLAGVDVQCPTDNVASFTALANDHGWDEAAPLWLEASNLGDRDALLIFSVGGGSIDPPVSVGLVRAMISASATGCRVAGIVGPKGGEALSQADICIRVPVTVPEFQTTHTEIFQSVIWHLLVLHPVLQRRQPKWESLGLGEGE